MFSIDEWQKKGDYLSNDGRRIFYIDTNLEAPQITEKETKETILLIHGFPTSSWDWAKIWTPLSEKYHLIAMDMLGFGLSDKPDPHDYSIHEQADIVEALIEKLGLTTFHVLAHDYGDTVAQELLARQNAGTGRGDWKSICFLNG
ncbi:MAG: alpha/beta fold hydrolase, partial [Maricaulaceae bacterium]